MNLKEVLDSLEKGHVVTAHVNGQSIPLTRYTEFTTEKRYVTVEDVMFPKGLTEPPCLGETYYIPMLDEVTEVRPKVQKHFEAYNDLFRML